uniref:ABC transporter permease n=1 Tax=Pleurostichidium falkenbergii TaxID=121064 RepID=A0A4D6UXG2_9FLOR|nr:hypothetical protein [Pleurostichidium falkenbergii]QCH39596.1 hypothetical protein [Pleurostichidium falkenbergii]
MKNFFRRLMLFAKLFVSLCNYSNYIDLDYDNVLNQLILIGPNSISITVITSFFISLVLALQIIKEFLYLNVGSLVGSVLAISFIRELSPVLTSIIVIGKIGSLFTSEIATMRITEQIDALLVLGINPVNYLVLPRLIAIIIMLPLLNLFSLFTGFMSSAFFCFTMYSINPFFFLKSLLYSLFYIDLLKSTLKILIFGFFIALVSCVWGMTAEGGSKGVGLSTTSSVVTSLVLVFIFNFILSYFMFNDSLSSFEIL